MFMYIYSASNITTTTTTTTTTTKKKQINKTKSNIWEVCTAGKSGICSTQVEIVLSQVIMK